MSISLATAREYAQLWIEYDALKLKLNKLYPETLIFQITSDMCGVLGERLSEIKEDVAAHYRKGSKA